MSLFLRIITFAARVAILSALIILPFIAVELIMQLIKPIMTELGYAAIFLVPIGAFFFIKRVMR